MFWEPIEGATPSAFLLTQTPSTATALRRQLWAIASAAALRICVIDERIQEVVGTQIWENGRRNEMLRMPALDVLERMHIYVPRLSEFDLKNPQLASIKDYLARCRPHVLAIHSGVLDKLDAKTPETAQHLIQELSLSLSSTFRRIVVHSGRGIPVNVPEMTVPFVSYAAIESTLASKALKSKFILTQELMSARGIHR